MATIKGLSLKSIKEGIGHDMAGWQGNLYLNNKKVGYVLDDGYGGCLDISVEPKFREDVQKAVQEALNSPSIKFDSENPNEEDFYNYLYIFTMSEKDFKKANKKGYECLLNISFYPRTEEGYIDYKNMSAYRPSLTYSVPKVSQVQALLDKEKPTAYELYSKAEDFVIV